MRLLTYLSLVLALAATTACNTEYPADDPEADSDNDGLLLVETPEPAGTPTLENPITISGAVVGLTGQVTISLNRVHKQTLNAVDTFQFEGSVPQGFEYELRVEHQAEGQFCHFDRREVGVVIDAFDIQLICTDLMAVTVSLDTDGDGTPDARFKEFVNAQRLPVKTMIDPYARAEYQDIFTFNYNFDKSKTAYFWDRSGDGVDEITLRNYYDINGNKTLTERDDYVDGTIDAMVTRTYRSEYPYTQTEEITTQLTDGLPSRIERETYTECGDSYYIDSNGDGELDFTDGDSSVTWNCKYENDDMVQQIKAEDDKAVYMKTINITREPGVKIVTAEEFDSLAPGRLDTSPFSRKEEIFISDSEQILSRIEWQLNERSQLYIHNSRRWEYHDNGNPSFYRYHFSADNRVSRITETRYNTDGKRISIIVKEADNLENLQETTYEYSFNQMVQTIMDYEDTSTTTNTYTFYSSGRKKSLVKEFDYGSNGVITTREITRFLDSGTNGLIKSSSLDENADGLIDETETFTYNSNDVLTDFTRIKQGETVESNQYDDFGKALRLMQIGIGGIEQVIEKEYDADGRISQYSYYEDNVLQRRDSYRYSGNANIGYEKTFVCDDDMRGDRCVSL